MDPLLLRMISGRSHRKAITETGKQNCEKVKTLWNKSENFSIKDKYLIGFAKKWVKATLENKIVAH